MDRGARCKLCLGIQATIDRIPRKFSHALHAMKPDIYLIELVGSGSISMMAKPVSGEWIDGEFRNIALEGIDRIVSLLERNESYDVGLKDEEALAIKHGMAFHSYPIEDRGVPDSKARFRTLTKELYNLAAGGENVVIHCRAGIGRAGLLTAAVLLHCAFDAIEAFEHLSAKRGVTVPDTEEQRNWLIENQSFILDSWE